MKDESRREREKILFAIENIQKVAERRKNGEVVVLLTRLRKLLKYVEDLEEADPSDERVSVLLRQAETAALFLSSELRTPIKFEIKEVITPIVEVKRDVREFSRRMWTNYFQWLPAEVLSAEEILGMLEEDLKKLDIAEEQLNPNPTKGRKR
jgi:hypothetical protein